MTRESKAALKIIIKKKSFWDKFMYYSLMQQVWIEPDFYRGGNRLCEKIRWYHPLVLILFIVGIFCYILYGLYNFGLDVKEALSKNEYTIH